MNIFSFEGVKGLIIAHVPLTNDAIHIYVGLGLYIGLCLVFRRPLTWWPALIPGFVLSFVIEVLDIAHGSHPLWSVKDIVNQQFWPVVLYLTARFHRVGDERGTSSEPGSRRSAP